MDEGAPRSGCLGVQITPLFDEVGNIHDMENWVEVGMTIDVQRQGSHRYVPQ